MDEKMKFKVVIAEGSLKAERGKLSVSGARSNG